MNKVHVPLVMLLSLAMLALFPAAASAAIAKPETVAPLDGSLDVSFNPTLKGSAYNGTAVHKKTDWQVNNSPETGSTITPEWTRTSTVAETQTVVSAANGTFQNQLTGKTRLESNERYFWRVRYQDNNSDWSDWSDYSLFITATTSWYLAEGSTAGGMETWVLVQNPGSSDAVVEIDFQTDTGLVTGPRDTIPHDSRRSYFVGSYVNTYDVSTKVTATSGSVVCERAVYGPGRNWGHDSIGVTSPASTWYLAEGATAGGFETWVLVQNPNATPVTVDITLQTDSGLVTPDELQGVAIPAASRKTFNLGLYAETYNVSTRVVSTGDGVICERAMYGNNRQWGHDSIGTTLKTFAWGMAEGCTEGGMETWVLVQNPETRDQTVLFIFADETGSGPIMGPSLTIPGNSRISVNIGDYIQSYNVSISVQTWNQSGLDTSGQIICERAMYDTSRTWGHDSIASPYGLNVWTLPEGSTAGGMETWVLVFNFHISNPVDVQLVFMTDEGVVMGPSDQIPPFARRSYNVGDYVDTYNVSTLVDANSEYVICERSMYGPGRAWAHNSIGYILGLGNATASSAAGAGFDAARNR